MARVSKWSGDETLLTYKGSLTILLCETIGWGQLLLAITLGWAIGGNHIS
jgi:hypothetical protein